ncbi:hypothetical protein FRX31_033516, partial [Thalictrum thalictroides]
GRRNRHWTPGSGGYCAPGTERYKHWTPQALDAALGARQRQELARPELASGSLPGCQDNFSSIAAGSLPDYQDNFSSIAAGSLPGCQDNFSSIAAGQAAKAVAGRVVHNTKTFVVGQWEPGSDHGAFGQESCRWTM